MTVSAQPTVLLTSGTYVSAEIAAEFGRIPPSFLPIGNRRLYRWQLEEIRRALPDARVAMSLPQGFDMSDADRRALEAEQVELIFAPPELSLGAALNYVILAGNLIAAPLCILHGDTLLQDYPFDTPDAVSEGLTRTYYPWADFSLEDGRLSFDPVGEMKTDRRVLTGAFHIADVPLFLKGLAKSQNSFLGALAAYSAERPVQSIRSGQWFDFGHLHTYFQSRRAVTTARHFNRLVSEEHFFVKSSPKRLKIEAEREWFRGLPEELKVFTPQVLPVADVDGLAAYRIEYCYLATLNDLYVFGRLPPSVWRSIFDACGDFLETAATFRSPVPLADAGLSLYLDKTLERLEQFAAETGLDMDAEWRINGAPTPSLRRMAESVAHAVGPAPDERLAIVHGDFCFSNVLFDFRTQRVKVIDPRGVSQAGEKTLFGDTRYEAAKLHHSVIGLYDHIIAGQFEMGRPATYDLDLRLPEDPALDEVQALFRRTRIYGESLADLKSHEISTLLFLSMLPLHSDNASRQWALLANALRLYRELERSAG